MELVGGRTNYGEDIGILMLDTVFPRIPGDIGNARTYSFPVRYKTVKNATADKIMGDKVDEALIAPFIAAARELEAEGVKAITTSCGFLAPFQRTLADSVNVPVFTSALMLAPLVRTMINRDRKIGIFTERGRHMSDEHFRGVGWSTDDIPVAVSGMPEGSPFPELFIGNSLKGDRRVLEKCMVDLAEDHMKRHRDTGAIIFECTNFGPFTRCVQDVAGVPVFGINQLLEYVAAVVNVKSYY